MFDNEKIKACVNGDPKASRELFETNRDWLFSVCRRYIKNYEQAEDILQESFILIFNKLHQFKGDGDIKAWMRRIVVNCALGEIRKSKSIQFVPFDNQINPVDLGVLESLGYEELSFIINRLSPGRRHVFLAFAVDGLSHKEIAQQLNISEGTSKSQFFDARKEIQKVLQNELLLARKSESK